MLALEVAKAAMVMRNHQGASVAHVSRLREAEVCAHFGLHARLDLGRTLAGRETSTPG